MAEVRRSRWCRRQPREEDAIGAGVATDLVDASRHRLDGSRRVERIKRVIDVMIAGSALAVLCPAMIGVAVLIRRSTPGPALFRQTRVGLGGMPFTLLKFRSMRVGGDDQALRDLVRRELAGEQVPTDGSFKLTSDHRTTPIGRWLRSTSMDELPQLVCVLRGDMSIVGPRPALEWEHEMFPEAYRRRVEVLPGITGLWQTSGRSTVDTLAMLQLDLDYLERRSLRLDLSIMVATVAVLLRGDGAR